MAFTLDELAKHVGGHVKGKKDYIIEGIAPLSIAQSNQISFLVSKRYQKELSKTSAGAVIVSDADSTLCSANLLIVSNPQVAYASIVEIFYPELFLLQSGIHSSAVILPHATIDPTAWIGSNCIIEENVTVGAHVQIGSGCVVQKNSTIGANSVLVASVTLCRDTIIGERALIQPGVVIGGDGFGIVNDNGSWKKIPQLGKVRIGNDVEIGTNTAIDCGSYEDTIIGNGVKIDNLVHIAHNVQIGDHTVIAGCTGIAGSAKIGKHCAMGGGVDINGHINIVDNVILTGRTLVTASINKPGTYSSSTVAEPNQSWRKNTIRFKQLDAIARRLKALENTFNDKH